MDTVTLLSCWEFFLPLSQQQLLPRLVSAGSRPPSPPAGWLTFLQGVGSKLCFLQPRQTFLLPRGRGASVITGWPWGFPQSVTLCNLWELLSAPWRFLRCCVVSLWVVRWSAWALAYTGSLLSASWAAAHGRGGRVTVRRRLVCFGGC